MRLIILLLPLFISFYKCEVIEYWNPLDPVVARLKNETTKMQSFVDEQTANAKNFIDDQTAKMKDFVQAQKIKVENALNAGYNEAKKMRESVSSYVEDQQKLISEEVNNYVQGVKESSNIAFDTYVPGNDIKSRLDNPDLALSVPSIISKNGYICETHTIISQGYLLNVHRIPTAKHSGVIAKKVVLLQHGIFASSADWILNGAEKGLAYVLADAGYDVWMTNIRGNRYSREHAWLKTDSKEYWDFSWHEVAMYDVPAVIDYIISIKGVDTKITYIGHSMGTTILFTMLTMRPEYNDILSAAFALAPVAFMSHIKSPLKSLAPIASNVAYMEMLYGSHEFIPKNSALGKLSTSCDLQSDDFSVCKNVVFYICGYDEKQFNKTLLPIFINNLGTGTSWKTAVHFAQEITSGGRFQQFDHGYYNNLKIYGSPQPPEYDLSKITLPITLFWSKNDLLSSEEDVRILHGKLTKSEMYMVPFQEFNHLDYLWAVDADKLLNDKILELLTRSFSKDRNGFTFSFGFGN